MTLSSEHGSNKDAKTPESGTPQAQQKPCCPKCGEELPTVAYTNTKPRSRIAMKLSPAPGELMCLDTIGGVLKEWDKLLKACGDDLNAPCVNLVSGAKFNENNEITIEVIIARIGTPEYAIKKRRGKRRGQAQSDRR